MARSAIPTWCFAIVVVRRGDRFLLVQESKHGNAWYFPAGRTEPGETLFETASRETLEEAGVRIRLTGILRFEHTIAPERDARLRVLFVAEALPGETPKSHADEHSIKAQWFTLEELDRVRLRGEEVRVVLAYVASGGHVFPLDVLGAENDGWPRR
jgi:phosphatase NudJ